MRRGQGDAARDLRTAPLGWTPSWADVSIGRSSEGFPAARSRPDVIGLKASTELAQPGSHSTDGGGEARVWSRFGMSGKQQPQTSDWVTDVSKED